MTDYYSGDRMNTYSCKHMAADNFCYVQGAARKSFTTKSEQKKAELKNMMRMNQLE